VVKGKDLFDVSLFSSSTTTSVFYTFIASLRQSILSANSTSTHKFIRTLHERGKLLRCYTQNIDGIETQEGLVVGGKEAQICQLHGDIHTLRCDYCSIIQNYTEEWMEMLLDGSAPDCPDCVAKCIPSHPWPDIGSLRESKGKRGIRIGTLLPNIVLYNDPTPHPSTTTTSTVISADLSKRPDLLLVFGTSLKVHGIKKLVKDFAKTVHANKGVVILVNKGELGKSEWKNVIDYWVEGDCDEWVHDLKRRIPNLWMKQEHLPVMHVKKPSVPKCMHLFVCLIVDLKKKVSATEDKENHVPTAPKGIEATPTVLEATGSTLPLTPSKRGINQLTSLESPTKRLQISSKTSLASGPPPPFNLPFPQLPRLST
jgi:NAD+-dependent protein deacetylase SIR2